MIPSSRILIVDDEPFNVDYSDVLESTQGRLSTSCMPVPTPEIHVVHAPAAIVAGEAQLSGGVSGCSRRRSF